MRDRTAPSATSFAFCNFSGGAWLILAAVAAVMAKAVPRKKHCATKKVDMEYFMILCGCISMPAKSIKKNMPRSVMAMKTSSLLLMSPINGCDGASLAPIAPKAIPATNSPIRVG